MQSCYNITQIFLNENIEVPTLTKRRKKKLIHKSYYLIFQFQSMHCVYVITKLLASIPHDRSLTLMETYH